MIRKSEHKVKQSIRRLFGILKGTMMSEQELLNRLDIIENSPVDSLYIRE